MRMRKAAVTAVALAGSAAFMLAAGGTAGAEVLGYYGSYAACQQTAMYVRTHSDGEARCISNGAGLYEVVYMPSTLTEHW